jgi:hypothetical protein
VKVLQAVNKVFGYTVLGGGLQTLVLLLKLYDLFVKLCKLSVGCRGRRGFYIPSYKQRHDDYISIFRQGDRQEGMLCIKLCCLKND